MLSIKTTALCSSHFFDIYKAKKENLLIVKYSGLFSQPAYFPVKERLVCINNFFLSYTIAIQYLY